MHCTPVQRQPFLEVLKKRLTLPLYRRRHILMEHSLRIMRQAQYFSERLRQTKQKPTPSVQHSARVLLMRIKEKPHSSISKSAGMVGKRSLMEVVAVPEVLVVPRARAAEAVASASVGAVPVQSRACS